MTNYEKDWYTSTRTPVYYVLLLGDVRVIPVNDKQTEVYHLAI